MVIFKTHFRFFFITGIIKYNKSLLLLKPAFLYDHKKMQKTHQLSTTLSQPKKENNSAKFWPHCCSMSNLTLTEADLL